MRYDLNIESADDTATSALCLSIHDKSQAAQ